MKNMNGKLFLSYLFLVIASFPIAIGIGCRGSVKDKDKINTPASSLSLHVGDERYAVIDTKESVVGWKGSNPFGPHTGYVKISKGELMMEDGQLAGGTVEVDMTTIEDENHKSNSGLIEHLKDPDFFDVKIFPFSAITITKVASINVEDKEITGNLTIKGITRPVTFPAKIEVKDGIVKANGKLVIDRTDWGIRYNSGKFFDNLADETISDSIEFNIRIVAKNKK
jgi:polyisoprenoid-binding protein YceI